MTGRWTRGALSSERSLSSPRRSQPRRPPGSTHAAVPPAKTVNVGFIYPKTGGLAAFGQEEYDGFQAGLAYTKGKCGGYTINPTYVDDATDPATAVTAFKNLVGQGTKIIAGTGSSGIALQLGAARRAEQRPLHLRRGGGRRDHRAQPEHVPRRPADAAGRARRGEHLPAEVDGQEGRRLRRGHRVRRRATSRPSSSIFGGKGHTVSKILSPFGAADLTPFAQQLKNSSADAAFVAWANTTNSAAMWQSLQQQGVLEADDDRHRPREPRESTTRSARSCRASRCSRTTSTRRRRTP